MVMSWTKTGNSGKGVRLGEWRRNHALLPAAALVVLLSSRAVRDRGPGLRREMRARNVAWELWVQSKP